MKYSVCVIPRIKVRIDGIEAGSQEEAAEKAIEHFNHSASSLINRDVSGVPQVRYLESSEDEDEFIVLVDEEGDEEFEESNWFYRIHTSEVKVVRMRAGAWKRLKEAQDGFADTELKLLKEDDNG